MGLTVESDETSKRPQKNLWEEIGKKNEDLPVDRQLEFSLKIIGELFAHELPMTAENRKYFKDMKEFCQPSSSVCRINRGFSQLEKAFDCMEIKHTLAPFQTDEFEVKVIDGYVVLRGVHGQKREGLGHTSRTMTRRYALPQGCNLESVTYSARERFGNFIVKVYWDCD